MMKSSEIRSTFINYYKKNGHTHVPSSNLIPENDNTLLFANSGMVQFKNSFLGLEKRDYVRAVTSQKCIRAGGKHNDLDNVGFTARHHTFFEMLGNFSFGDYFKKDAIHYAWDVLTNEFQIPKDKLYVTCHISDDEAADIWHKQEGVPKDRIFRFDKDNFWRMGDIGPCGPCTEIFYDHGARAGKESDPFKGIAAGEDRYVEIWNQVFMQYDETSPGVLKPLPKPSVDTGMGFERLVAALQGQFSNYDTELFAPMLDVASKIAKLDYVTDPEVLRTQKDIFERVSAMRVLADHCRAVSFLLADGALPSNEGRGYVLRRIMRRAIRYGRKLSTQSSFLTPMSESLISHMSDFYPELSTRKNHILSTIKDEENRFLQTLDNGTGILQDEIKKLKSQNQKSVSGETLFKMYDTYGFPVDLTSLMAAEHGLTADETAFEKIMQSSKEKAKSTWKSKSLKSDEKHVIEFGQKYSASSATKFLGYDSLHTASKVLALSNGSAEVQELKASESGFVILDQTTFYAEGGGQVGDHGQITASGFKALVHDCIKVGNCFLHQIEILEGSLKLNSTVNSEVDNHERRQTIANHSATHLMHAALRKVLGTHVTQAGSLVDTTKTRFDFTHNKPVSTEEIKHIEDLVNAEISAAHTVSAEVMPHSKAIEKGAMALFGEKYGDQVRVLTMGTFSCELCGGTHVKNTAQIRAFKIMSESGVSAGVRRIEAITGDAVIEYFLKNTDELKQAKNSAGLSTDKLLTTWIDDKKEEIKSLQKEIQKIQSSQINVDEIFQSAKEFNSAAGSAKYIFADLALDDREVLSNVSDQLKNKIQKGIVVVVGKGDATHPVIISVSKDLTGQYQAGTLLKDFALILGGKGGGRPDFAQGAVPDRTKINEGRDFLNKKILS
jgi:alanyl-tRNA synthetase